MQLFERLWWRRYFGHVQRFHGECLIGEKPTVYYHSASVAIILIELLEERCSANLLKAALQHDLEEGCTGDIPAPVKWEAKDLVDSLEERIRKFYEIQVPTLTEEEIRYLKAADFLDAVMTCLEQRRLGNRFIDRCFENYKRYAERSNLCSVDIKAEKLWTKISQAYYLEQLQSENPHMRTTTEGCFWLNQK